MDNKQNWQPQNQEQQPNYSRNQAFSQAQTTTTGWPLNAVTSATSTTGSVGGWPLNVTSTTTTPTQMSPQFYPPIDYSQWYQRQLQQQTVVTQGTQGHPPSTLPHTPLTHHQANVPQPFFPYPFFNPLQYPQHQQTFPTMPQALPQLPTDNNTQIAQIAQFPQIPQLSSAQQNTEILQRNVELAERKRPRITYSPQQITYLEAWYNTRNQFISTQERNHLAQFLGVNANQIRIWFQNRRARDRRRMHRRSVDTNNSSLNSTPTPNGSFSGTDSPYSASPLTTSNDSGLGLGSSATNSPFSTPFSSTIPMGTSMFDILRYKSMAEAGNLEIQNQGQNQENQENNLIPKNSQE